MVTADLNDKGNRIEVRFPYQLEIVAAVKAIPGAKFLPEEKGGPAWRLPLDLNSGRALRAAVPDFSIGPALKAWGQQELWRERQLVALARAVDAELPNLERAHPALARQLRPYQRADVAFGNVRQNVLNANAPGVGKTIETIASIFDQCGDSGRHLIVCGITSQRVVWEDQLRQWTDMVFVADGTPAEREAAILTFYGSRSDRAAFLIVNPAMVQLVAEYEIDDQGKKLEVGTHERYPVLFDGVWDTLVLDEFHQMGLGNTKTLTRRGLVALRANRRIALSGTPTGGRPIKLWVVLNYLHPQIFTSKWRWAETWLEMESNQYASSGKTITDRIKAEKEEEFIRYHSQFMIRRSKDEVRADLPKKNMIDVWVDLIGEQKKQYDQFDAEAELILEEEGVTATNALTQYLRLRQLAGSVCSIDENTLWPQPKGAKLEQMMRILADHGICRDREGSEQALVFTQFTKLANVAVKMLRAEGLNVWTITGETSPDSRAQAVRLFEQGDVDVLVMNTKAGGTALTLNNSDLIVFLDETWNPDDQYQAEERNRNNSADIYYIRARNTIDEEVWEVTGGKQAVNAQILDKIRDLRRSK